MSSSFVFDAIGDFSSFIGLIQLMACAQAGKSLAYCTFSDAEFSRKALHVFEVLCSSACTVGRLTVSLRYLR